MTDIECLSSVLYREAKRQRQILKRTKLKISRKKVIARIHLFSSAAWQVQSQNDWLLEKARIELMAWQKLITKHYKYRKIRDVI